MQKKYIIISINISTLRHKIQPPNEEQDMNIEQACMETDDFQSSQLL